MSVHCNTKILFYFIFKHILQNEKTNILQKPFLDMFPVNNHLDKSVAEQLINETPTTKDNENKATDEKVQEPRNSENR